jgi:hypothetical protein
VYRRLGGTKGLRDYNFFCEKGNENHQLRPGFFVQHRTVTTVKRVEFLSDRVSYIVLRGHWYNIIVLNVHAPSEEKSNDSKDSSAQFYMYHVLWINETYKVFFFYKDQHIHLRV